MNNPTTMLSTYEITHPPKSRQQWSSLLLFFVGMLVVKNEAFVINNNARGAGEKIRTLSHSPQKYSCLALAASASNQEDEQANNEEDEEDWDPSPSSPSMDAPMGPEKSRMVHYISDFLKKEANVDDQGEDSAASSNNNHNKEECTHLIAIPLGACHDLAIELESVQRAILYHCPVLVHACVVSATTRLPLLYVHAPSLQQSTMTTQEATDMLHQIVEEVVQKHINVKPEINTDVVKVDEHGVVEEEPLHGLNKEGIRPLALTFQSLEIDGPNNQVLQTVALPDDPGTRRLQQFVLELQQTIATRLKWKTSLPPDDHIASGNDDDDDDTDNENKQAPPVFRPRVPFMRIPSNFEDYLDPLPEDRDEEYMRTSDEGGNGISPIFWASWWDDVFGTTRMREIGIYPRTSSSFSATGGGIAGLGEDAFHMPFRLTCLPDGNDSLTKQEAKFESYQEQRIQQAEYDFEQDQAEEMGLKDSSAREDALVDDPLLEKTRARLESLYQEGNPVATSDDSDLDQLLAEEEEEQRRRPKVDATLLDDWTQARIRQANMAQGNTMYDADDEEDGQYDDVQKEIQESIAGDAVEPDSKPSAPTADDNDPNQLDDWTRERIRKTIASRQSVKTQEQLATKKDKVPIQDNSVFQKFKDGTLVPEAQKQAAWKGKEIAPFPSREQFVGFWQIMSSPTGFPPDDDGGDGSKSENLVFRVDGTTAGGPVLDPETNQKAAGGTWKITPSEDDEDESAQVRIRLVIPPKKDRILVMEGTATKRAMVSLKNLPPMASSTFGIPELEEKTNKSKQDDTDVDEEKIYCSGKV